MFSINNKIDQKIWQLKPKQTDYLIDQLLINRHINIEDRERFLSPSFENDIFDPFLMNGMDKATELIWSALKANRRIGVFADYDADGIPAAAILYETVCYINHLQAEQSLNAPVVYIPSREEGYGLNKIGIDWLKAQGVSLLITLDLGIKSQEEVEYARSQGLDCVIVDHHLVGDDLPKESIIINPKQPGEQYPFKDFSAGGLAWKLACALLDKMNTKDKTKSNIFLKWLLDLAAISTICDMVPLVGENRVIARYGVIVLRQTRRAGLKSMYELAHIKPDTIDPYHVGFLIGPRINAPGRMDHASPAFYCLVSDDPSEARKLARNLNEINQARQLELERVLAEAKERVIRDRLYEKKVIMVSGESWPSGIVGLVAGKLLEEFARPTIVLSKDEQIARGSARSIEAFHIVEAFDHASRYLTKYGGHAKAAGLTVENQHLEALYDLLLEYADEKLTDEDLVPTITIDAKINPEQITLTLLDELKQLEPHGIGNPRPVFLVEKLLIDQVRSVGKQGNHVKLSLVDQKSSTTLPAIYFNGSHRLDDLKEGQLIDCVVTFHEDTWGGNRRIDCHVVDFRQSG
jgi:single-stranded-DNA-specific exonuclease